MLKNTIYYDNVWNVAFDTHGREYAIKVHRDWKFINIGDKKVGVSKLPIRTQIKDFDDVIANYTCHWHRTSPCPAIAYSVYRKVTNKKISLKDYYNNIFLSRT
jgi:hypothetical protein